MIEEWNADQIYGIMEGGTKGIEKIVNRIFVDKKDIIAEFLSRLNWICERVEFHTENPDSELMDELIEEYHKWEEKAK